MYSAKNYVCINSLIFLMTYENEFSKTENLVPVATDNRISGIISRTLVFSKRTTGVDVIAGIRYCGYYVGNTYPSCHSIDAIREQGPEVELQSQ